MPTGAKQMLSVDSLLPNDHLLAYLDVVLIGHALCVRKLSMVEYGAVYSRLRFDSMFTEYADVFAEAGEQPDHTIEHEINPATPTAQLPHLI